MSRVGFVEVVVLALLVIVGVLTLSNLRHDHENDRLRARVACLEAIAGGASQMPPTRGCLP